MRINQTFWQFLILIIGLAAFAACQSSANKDGNPARTGGGPTPTEAYKNLFAAVKKKDVEAIKANMSKATLEFSQSAAQMQQKPVEKFLENGLIQANLSPNLPAVRDERVKGEFGAVEVQDPDGKWEDVPFVREDGNWKLAVGDIFKGSYQKPAPSAAEKTANTTMPQMIPAPDANKSTDTNNGVKQRDTSSKPGKPNSSEAGGK